ncbi:MAG: hypothetical protein ACXVEE_38740 [Polyangiales bacterium]
MGTGAVLDSTEPADTAVPPDTRVVVVDAAPIDVGCASPATCPAPSNECMMATCVGGTCGIGPRPAGTSCNMLTDQCDGAGTCVDCVNSGGCDECCVCASNKCVPA